MSARPWTVDPAGPEGTGVRIGTDSYFGATIARMRASPRTGKLARRRWTITLTKFLLPAAALALLTTVALWPEMKRATEQARLAVARVATEVQSGQLLDARYHGVDEKGRPFTLTAATAHQVDPERIDLTLPKGDITMESGSWLMLQARKGTYMQRTNQLDLSQDVTLYREDGTTLVTASASVDLKAGAAAGADPVHAEGPFGVLDAAGGFTVVDKGASIQFTGPTHLVMNGASAP